jgi:enterochelin esterase family protein
LVVALSLALVSSTARAETLPPPPGMPTQNTPPPYLSPEVHADRKVTFRIQAKNAAEVLLEPDWLVNEKPKLTKDAKGLWSVTVGPLAPGVYIYGFKVDGVSQNDPLSGDTKLRTRTAGSLVRVPGEAPGFWEYRDAPHGVIELQWLRAKTLGGQARQVNVYLPPGYAKDTKKKYPVLYLLPGNNATPMDWTTAGLVNFVMDDLYADKKAVPMIIVMPGLHALPYEAPAMENNTALMKYVLEDVIPFVEGTYRAQADRAHRAVAGLSRGAAATVSLGLEHPETFGAAAAWSIGGPHDELAKEIAPALEKPDAINAKLKLFQISCGKKDLLFPKNEELMKLITSKGVKVSWVPTEGTHNWQLWRTNLHDTAPLLFR